MGYISGQDKGNGNKVHGGVMPLAYTIQEVSSVF